MLVIPTWRDPIHFILRMHVRASAFMRVPPPDCSPTQPPLGGGLLSWHPQGPRLPEQILLWGGMGKGDHQRQNFTASARAA